MIPNEVLNVKRPRRHPSPEFKQKAVALGVISESSVYRKVENTRRFGFKWVLRDIHIQPQRRDFTLKKRTKPAEKDRGESDALTMLIRAGASK